MKLKRISGEEKKKSNEKEISKSTAPIAKESSKKKRPWRNKVRKLAKKKRLAEERTKAIENGQPMMTNQGEKKKNKRNKKKKKQGNEVGEIHKKGANEEMDERSVEKKKIKPSVVSVEEAQQRMKSGRFRYLNEMLYTMSGAEAMQYFQKDPTAFDCYHDGFSEQAAKWPNQPLPVIVKWLMKQPPGRVVLDLGCGEAKLAKQVGHLHEVSSFDLVAQDERVTACDMAHLPVENGSADITVFCLSLMGTNLHEYVREAHRALKMGGILKIAEVSSRFTNLKLFVDAVQKMGFKNTEKKTLDDYFVMLQFTKNTEKCESKKPFGLNLKPCLYKKR